MIAANIAKRWNCWRRSLDFGYGLAYLFACDGIVT
jgi:hypothetical protein